MKKILSDYFSTYMEQHRIASLRAQDGITLEVIPPDMHHKNTYSEGAIYLQRKAARARLAQIQGMIVRGSRTSNTEKYWPFAWEHATQCHNFSAYESLTQLHGHAISPIQAFTGDIKYRIPALREFGEIGYVLYQPSKRPNKLFDTSQRCYCMFAPRSPQSSERSEAVGRGAGYLLKRACVTRNRHCLYMLEVVHIGGGIVVRKWGG